MSCLYIYKGKGKGVVSFSCDKNDHDNYTLLELKDLSPKIVSIKLKYFLYNKKITSFMISNDLLNNKYATVKYFCILILYHKGNKFIIKFNGTQQDLYDFGLYPTKNIKFVIS